jgi:hypothetical protein
MRQCTEGILNLPNALGDQGMRSFIPLESRDSNSEDKLESPILGDENPHKNRRIPRRRLEITKEGHLMHPHNSS